MITTDNLAELLSAVPGAEPRLTNSRYTHRFLGFLRIVCGMCVSVQNTCRQACAVSLYLGIDSVTGKTCTSAWLIRKGLAGEVTFDLGLNDGWNLDKQKWRWVEGPRRWKSYLGK